MSKNTKHTIVSVLSTLGAVWATKQFPTQALEVTAGISALLTYLFHLPVTNGGADDPPRV